MHKFNLSRLVKSTALVLRKNSPAILLGIGISGMITTTILAVKATPKALKTFEHERDRREKESINSGNGGAIDPLSNTDMIKLAWKCYIPSLITGCASIACLIGASAVNSKRNAALATAYTISESALKEYKEKVVETIGDKKEKSIRDSIDKDKVVRNPAKSGDIIITEKGNTLCLDSLSGRYFKSDIDKIKKSVNILNRQMLDEMYVSINDFYYELGLSNIKVGDDIGWNVSDGLIDVTFSSQLNEDGTPCLVLNYSIQPRYGYSA